MLSEITFRVEKVLKCHLFRTVEEQLPDLLENKHIAELSLCCYGNSSDFTNQPDPQVQTSLCMCVCMCECV